MKLKVPLVRQGKGTPDCGPACLAMLARFYGWDVSVDGINRGLGRDGTNGMFPAEVGMYLLGLGFDVEVQTFDPRMFLKKDAGMGQKQVLERIANAKGDYLRESENYRCLGLMEDFMASSGVVNVKIPRIKDVADELYAGRPLIALLSPRFLNGVEPRLNFHYNVLTGYDGTHIYANDPAWGPSGGYKKYDVSDFIFAVYAGLAGDIFNCSLIKARENLLNLR